MSKSTEQWRAIYKARNERRKVRSTSERKADREMGRCLSIRMWDKSTNAPRILNETKK